MHIFELLCTIDVILVSSHSQLSFDTLLYMFIDLYDETNYVPSFILLSKSAQNKVLASLLIIPLRPWSSNPFQYSSSVLHKNSYTIYSSMAKVCRALGPAV